MQAMHKATRAEEIAGRLRGGEDRDPASELRGYPAHEGVRDMASGLSLAVERDPEA